MILNQGAKADDLMQSGRISLARNQAIRVMIDPAATAA